MSDINSETKVYGVIGDPIGHTLSPMLHNAVFKANGINAIYLPFHVKPDELSGAIEGLKSLQLGGLNVTVPHKEQAVYYVDATPNGLDRAIGAVNTLVLLQGKVLGFNTDGLGFLDDLEEQFNMDLKDKSAVVLGAGGAARAVTFSLIQAGVTHLYIHNRTHERAKGLVKYLVSHFNDLHVQIYAISSIDEIKIQSVDLMVNCTTCGMHEHDPHPVNPDILDKTKTVYDLIYAPRETMLLKEARRHDIPSANGIGMLLHQASIAHRLWFPEVDKKQIYSIMKKAFEAS